MSANDWLTAVAGALLVLASPVAALEAGPSVLAALASGVPAAVAGVLLLWLGISGRPR